MIDSASNQDAQFQQDPKPVASGSVIQEGEDESSESGSNKGGFIVRGAAYLIDSFLVALLLFPLAYLVPFSSELLLERMDSMYGLLLLLYLSLATGIYGTTLGKKFFNLRVIRTDSTKISLGRAFLREFFGKIVSSIFFSLGFFWIIWDKKKQGWHDKIADTYVIQERELGGLKKFLAYFIVLLLPILAILGIIAVFFLVALDPAGKLEEARQIQEEQQQKLQQDFPNQNQLRYN